MDTSIVCGKSAHPDHPDSNFLPLKHTRRRVLRAGDEGEEVS